MRTSQLHVLTMLCCLVIPGSFTLCALAQNESSNVRLPGNANTLMVIDVAKILQSPMARQMDWQSKLIKGQADRPLAVPASAKRVTIAAALHPVAMHTVWQAAIVELPGAPNLGNILRAQGGYLDQISGRDAAWTPNDVFFVQLGPKTLGIVRPGARQYITRWVNAKSNTEFSSYLKSAQQENADVVFAIDLQDMVGPTAVKYASDMGELPSLDKIQDGRAKLFAALGSAKGIRLNISVKDQMNGKLIVDFDNDVSMLGEAAKPFVIDVLKSADMYETTADAWNFKASGKQIVGEGAMAPDALNRLITLLAPVTTVPEAEPQDTTAAAPAQPASAADVTAASQKYYKTVSGILDSLSTKASPTDSATWLIAKARIIEQLPIMNVDPQLVAWGNMVAETLNRCAQELALGQQKAKIASLGVASPTGYTTYADNSGGGSDTADTRAAFRNAQDQRRQVAMTERGAAAERTLNMINQLLPTRGKIRAEMTQKYGVEF